MDRRNPGLHSIEFPASAGLLSWRSQIPGVSAADLSLRFAKSEFPGSQSTVGLQSRKFERDRYGEVRWAKGLDARGNWTMQAETRSARIAALKYFSGKPHIPVFAA